MYNHAPPEHICPFCLLIQGMEISHTEISQTDIVFQTAEATAFMATRNGITLQQSNEPAGDQKIWHYHLHVIARYSNDDFRNSPKEDFPPALRAEYAGNLRGWIESHKESTNEGSNLL